ncbi:MAG: hypothetical protein ACP5VS_08745 [Desulfomonilaceae bacterium]
MRRSNSVPTWGQKKSYCHEGYVSLDSAKASTGCRINYYNEVRVAPVAVRVSTGDCSPLWLQDQTSGRLSAQCREGQREKKT